MAEKSIRMGLIGAGRNMRNRHVPGLKAQEGVELVAVVNRTPESGERVASELGIRRVAAHWRELLEDDEIDAVCIGTWPYMHAPMTIAALERGKHVLCEARMAMNASQARDMLYASQRRPELVAQIVPGSATLPIDRTLIDLISGGAIGEIISVDARITPGSDFPDFDSPMHWRYDRDLSGNNIMTMGIWYECMMRWVGPMSSVFAIAQKVVPHRKNGHGRRTAMTIPDHVDIVGELEQGGQMRFAMSQVVGHAPHTVDVCVFGTEGTIRVTKSGSEGLRIFFGKRGDTGLQPVPIEADNRGERRVEEEFVNAIRGLETVTLNDFATGLRYMEWTDAVALSMRRRELVSLPLPA